MTIWLRIRSCALLTVGSATLGACGDGGGSIASMPTPDPNAHSVGYNFTVVGPLDPTPAWTTGTYRGLAASTHEDGSATQLPDGAVTLAVDASAKTYTLTVTGAPLTPAVFKIPPLSPACQSTCWTDSLIGYKVKSVTLWSDGVVRPSTDAIADAISGVYQFTSRAPDGSSRTDATLDVNGIPGRHVSLGSWNITQTTLKPDGTSVGTALGGSGVFVFGDRTAPTDIPVSGTAHYAIDPDQASSYPMPINRASLDVDFGARTIAATLAATIKYDVFPDGSMCCFGGEEVTPDPVSRVATVTSVSNARGVAPILPAGTFDIALAGTLLQQTTRVDKSPVADVTMPLQGWMAGAFFGPQATEIGGVYNLPNIFSPSANNVGGAFTAIKAP